MFEFWDFLALLLIIHLRFAFWDWIWTILIGLKSCLSLAASTGVLECGVGFKLAILWWGLG